jgi:O-antigen/teichoic acid export membrane protein
MAVEKTEIIPTIDHKPHATFFRQSGWLMVANISGGLMTLGVHPLNKIIPDSEYTAFGVLLMLVSCMPTTPLQMVFAQQSALAVATGRERQLARMIRLAWIWSLVVWAVAAVLVLIFKNAIVQSWQLPNTTGLLITLPLLLMSVWSPMFAGVMQGRQDFFWIGWSSIISGVARLGIAALFVAAFHFGAAGMMAGALIGIGFSAFIGIRRTRDFWSLPGENFDMKGLLKQVLPLMFGFGACQFFFTADTMYAKAYFSPDAMKPYVAAGTLSRSVLWLVLPLAAVMFPKLVHSNAKGQKNDLLKIVVIGTVIIGIASLLGLWLLGWIPVRILFKAEDVAPTMALIPWYAGAMVPLAVANVLLNDLMARSRFGVVPWTVLLALGYGLTLPSVLNHHPGNMIVLFQTLGAFNLALCGVCAWFVWGVKDRSAQAKV